MCTSDIHKTVKCVRINNCDDDDDHKRLMICVSTLTNDDPRSRFKRCLFEDFSFWIFFFSFLPYLYLYVAHFFCCHSIPSSRFFPKSKLTTGKRRNTFFSLAADVLSLSAMRAYFVCIATKNEYEECELSECERVQSFLAEWFELRWGRHWRRDRERERRKERSENKIELNAWVSVGYSRLCNNDDFCNDADGGCITNSEIMAAERCNGKNSLS